MDGRHPSDAGTNMQFPRGSPAAGEALAFLIAPLTIGLNAGGWAAA